MSTITQDASVSRTALWIGRVMSAIVILFLISTQHQAHALPIVTESMAELGYRRARSGARARHPHTDPGGALSVPRTSCSARSC